MTGGLLIPSTFFIHSIVNDSSVLRCFGIGVAIRSVISIISVVAVVSAVEVVVIIVPPVVAVPGIELHLHVDSLPPPRVGAVAAVAPGGCAPPSACVISETKRENVYDQAQAREENICVGCKDVGIYSISCGDRVGCIKIISRFSD